MPLLLIILAIVAAILVSWTNARFCPRCGAKNSIRHRHTRRDGGPDGRYKDNPLTCRACGYLGHSVSRSEYRAIVCERATASAARSTPSPSGRRAHRRWVPEGEELQIGSRRIQGGMLYVVDGTTDVTPTNPATVLLRLPIGVAGAPPPSYWPSYAHLTPHQRATYLDWLAGGKHDRGVDIGYVFLYFYGLEWRALVESEDRSAITRELVRLYHRYGTNRAFHDYSLRLLGALLLIGGRASTLDPIWRTIEEHLSEHKALPGLLLEAIVWQHADRKLPYRWAVEIARASATFKKGVAQERHRDLFDAALRQRFATRFGDGIAIPRVERNATTTYGWALRGAPNSVEIPTTTFVMERSSKRSDLATHAMWDGLREVWREATAAVIAEARGRRGSAAAQASPTSTDDELVSLQIAGDSRTASSPAESIPKRPAPTDRLQRWFHERVDDSGLVRTTLGELFAQAYGEDAPSFITKSQQVAMLEKVRELRFAIEPDALSGHKRTPNDEVRFIFECESSRSGDEVDRLRPLVEAAIAVAASDDSIDDTEMEAIIEHLDHRDKLSKDDHRRLRVYAQWLRETKQVDLGFNRLRRAGLPTPMRKAIASLGITVALRDGTVTDAERKALARLYQALDLPATELDQLLKPAGVGAAGVAIDWQAVARLQAETNEVQGMLAQVLAASDGGEGRLTDTPRAEAMPAPATSTPPPTRNTPAMAAAFPGLDTRAGQVLGQLTARTEITSVEFQALCAQAGLLPSAAIDLINEWSDERLGDRCIDGDGPYRIATSLLMTKE